MAFRVQITTLLAVIVTLQCATALTCSECKGETCVPKEKKCTGAGKDSCGGFNFGEKYTFKDCVDENFCGDDKIGTKLKGRTEQWTAVKAAITKEEAEKILTAGKDYYTFCCNQDTCNAANTLVATGSILFLIIGTLLGIFG